MNFQTRTEVELALYLLAACAGIYWLARLLFQIHTNGKAMKRRLEAQAGMAEPDYGRVTPPNPALHFSGLSDLKASEQRDQIRVLREQMNEGRSLDGDRHVTANGTTGWRPGLGNEADTSGRGKEDKALASPLTPVRGEGCVGSIPTPRPQAGSTPADPHTILPFKGYAFQFRPGGR